MIRHVTYRNGKIFICHWNDWKLSNFTHENGEKILIRATTRCSKRHVALPTHNMNDAHRFTLLDATSNLVYHIFCSLIDGKKSTFSSTHKIGTIFLIFSRTTKQTREHNSRTFNLWINTTAHTCDDLNHADDWSVIVCSRNNLYSNEFFKLGQSITFKIMILMSLNATTRLCLQRKMPFSTRN